MSIPNTLRWKTIKTLDSGGQAQIYEVKDSEGKYLGTYALKTLIPNKHEKAYERFYREIEAIKSLNHPYIIKVVDSSSPSDDFQYYVMEYFKNAKPLSQIYKDKKSPFKGNPLKSLDLFGKIAEVISVCEKNNPQIIHRDLSLNNILWLPNETIRVIDFGLCQIPNGEALTMTDEDIGTRHYMAPECEAGAEGQIIDVRSDLYSAGKILWSLITGQRAFAREKPVFLKKSMEKMFPNNPEAWHLHHIFEGTIRHDINKRWPDAAKAIYKYKRIRQVILHSCLPIQKIADLHCQLCGIGKLKETPLGHTLFANPQPSDIFYGRCGFCGTFFVIDKALIDKKAKEIKELE